MDMQTMTDIATKYMNEMPDDVIHTLVDVRMVLCDKVSDAVEHLKKDNETVALDAKGIFIGDPMEVTEDDDTEEVFLPSGEIIIIAENIKSVDEATIVLLHEFGHALGMTEEEVTQHGLVGDVSGQDEDDKSESDTAEIVTENKDKPNDV